jgi:hypothetical protein
MPAVSWLQSNFNGGELSPSLFGRVQEPRYKESLGSCLNYVPVIQGFADRRPGTFFVKEVKTSANFTRLIRFEFSTTQAYVLEFGNQYIRFYTNEGQVLSGGVAYEITSPFLTADLPLLVFTQKADVLYITHPTYWPNKLLRFGATNWRLQNIPFIDGPYRPSMQIQSLAGPDVPNVQSQVTVTKPAATLLVTANDSFNVAATANNAGLVQITTTADHNFVTAQPVWMAAVGGTVEANGVWDIDVIDARNFTLRGSAFVNAWTAGGTAKPALFNVPVLGGPLGSRLMRFLISGTWQWGILTFGIDPHQAQMITLPDQPGVTLTVATTEWRFGSWYPANYPGTVAFHEDRLCFAGTPANPNALECSKSSNYENFAPTGTDGSVKDNNALSFTLNSSDVNAMKWLVSDEKGLLGGTSSGEWIIRPSINQDAMTPTNISAKKTMSWGSASGVLANALGKATIFVQRGAKKIREMLFYFDIDGYRALDLTELSEHITGAGVTDSAKQILPYNLVWYVRNDGALIALTYEREMQVLKVGWSRHYLGGASDAAGDIPVVESIACIPAPDGTHDELWMIVKRRVNGATKRYIEYMAKYFEDTDNQEDAHFVDCGAVFDSPITITGGITQANPGVVTALAHGLANGNQVQIKGVVGMTQVNYRRYTVAGATANTFQLHDSDGNAIDTSAYGVYVSGGTVRKLVTSITGLTWLENETVDVLADGAVVKGLVVSNTGVLTLPNPTATAHIGYGYNSDVQLLPAEAGSAIGTALGKKRRTTRASIMVHRTLGMKYGMDAANLDTMNFRTDADGNNRPPGLFSGILQESIEADYDWLNQLLLRQDEPLPSRLLAVALDLDTQDRR